MARKFHLVLLLLALLAPTLEADRGYPNGLSYNSEHQHQLAHGQAQPLDLRESNHYYYTEDQVLDYGAQGTHLHPTAINFNHIDEPALQQELEQYINRIRVEPHNDDLFARETARVLRNQAHRLALWQAEKGAKKAELKRLGKQFLTVWQLMHLLNDLRLKKRNVFIMTTRTLLRLLAKKTRQISGQSNNKRPGK